MKVEGFELLEKLNGEMIQISASASGFNPPLYTIEECEFMLNEDSNKIYISDLENETDSTCIDVMNIIDIEETITQTIIYLTYGQINIAVI